MRCARRAATIWRSIPARWSERVAALQPEDLAILVYTSGTTGKPKGAMHLHGGLAWTVRQAALVLPQVEGDERMCFLPLCHIAERMIGEFSSIYAGSILNFVENPDTVPENVREIAPTIFFAVPRVWEKFYSAVTIAVKEAGRLQQWAYARAIGVGGRVADLVLQRKPVPAWLKLQFIVSRVLVLDNVRRLIGIHRSRYLLTGAAPIAPDLIRWYLSLGVPMLEGWGMTETTGLGIINRPDAIRIGTIGTARRAACRRASTRPPARSWCAGATCSRAISTSRRRPPRRSMPTAGCTPATSARSTTRATSASPTA